MPSVNEILKGLTLLANEYIAIAILWHVLFFWFLLIYFFVKQKISSQLIGYFLFLPLFSVSICAWQTRNPFNGIIFLAGGILLFFLAAKKKKDTVGANSGSWSKIIGSLIFLSGFFYPHFLDKSFWSYLYAAPIGLIPCPTLLMISGIALLLGSKQPKSWFWVLIIFDAFYGLFGVFKLKVYLDLILIAATIALIFQMRGIKKSKASLVTQSQAIILSKN